MIYIVNWKFAHEYLEEIILISCINYNYFHFDIHQTSRENIFLKTKTISLFEVVGGVNLTSIV